MYINCGFHCGKQTKERPFHGTTTQGVAVVAVILGLQGARSAKLRAHFKKEKFVEKTLWSWLKTILEYFVCLTLSRVLGPFCLAVFLHSNSLKLSSASVEEVDRKSKAVLAEFVHLKLFSVFAVESKYAENWPRYQIGLQGRLVSAQKKHHPKQSRCKNDFFAYHLVVLFWAAEQVLWSHPSSLLWRIPIPQDRVLLNPLHNRCDGLKSINLCDPIPRRNSCLVGHRVWCPQSESHDLLLWCTDALLNLRDAQKEPCAVQGQSWGLDHGEAVQKKPKHKQMALGRE